MVEKLGHKKMIQSARMDWINEGKPKSSVHEDSLFDEPELPARNDIEQVKTAPRIAPIFEGPKTPPTNRDPDFDDMYDATPKAVRQNPAAQSTSIFGGGNSSLFGPPKVTAAEDDGPPDDELEALLAEAEQEGGNDEGLDDDLEALLAAENNMTAPSRPTKQAEVDDMEAMEAMADMDMDMDMNGGW